MVASVNTIAQQAKAAASKLARASASLRNDALAAMAAALIDKKDYILAQNQKDIDLAKSNNTSLSLIDRLMLDETRIAGIADALKVLAKQSDPLGKVIEGRTLYNGIKMQRITVPLGVVAMIYEARPNVCADAAGLCLKTGNACILRGGSMAQHSNIAITKVLYEAGLACGLPKHWLQSIETTDRSATIELMNQRGLIDVLVPRGSASLIKSTVENSRIPVIETGEGNCHLYIHEACDKEMIVPIAINAKTQRPSVCNTIESVLVDKTLVADVLPSLMQAFCENNVEMFVDAPSLESAKAAKAAGFKLNFDMIKVAGDDDWACEYLDLKISIKTVTGLDEAIEHINKYGTHHSETILSLDLEAVDRFLQEVDSAAVYANASTRFTDGGEFGLGAEIGISTQKLHARGPMGLDALTSSKFILQGSGQIR